MWTPSPEQIIIAEQREARLALSDRTQLPENTTDPTNPIRPEAPN